MDGTTHILCTHRTNYINKDMSDTQKIRLQKFLADQGICSRRKAEEWIEEAAVQVNGEIASLGCKVDPENDRIQLNGKVIQNKTPESIVLAMHKPRGVLCSNHDPFYKETIFDLLPREYQRERLFCVGRLDKESEGLIILTNDGDLSNKLTHPSFSITKKYLVDLNRPFNPDDRPRLLQGVFDKDEQLRVNKVIFPQKSMHAIRRLEVHLTQGKKREIRRIFGLLGYQVKRLKRTQIGRLKLNRIASGRVELLGKKDIELLLS